MVTTATQKLINIFTSLFQAIQESITVLAPLMSNYADTHNDLAKHCSANEVAEAAKELERSKERYQVLRAEIEKRGIQVGMTLQQEEQLLVMLEELILHLEKRKEELHNLEPVGIHSDVVREQLHAHEVSRGFKLCLCIANTRCQYMYVAPTVSECHLFD